MLLKIRKFFLIIVILSSFSALLTSKVQAIPSGDVVQTLFFEYDGQRYDSDESPAVPSGSSFKLGGVVEPGDKIEIEFANGLVLGTTADEAGNWEIEINSDDLDFGDNEYYMSITSSASGEKRRSGPFGVNVTAGDLPETGEEKKNSLSNFVIPLNLATTALSLVLSVTSVLQVSRGISSLTVSKGLKILKVILPVVGISLSFIMLGSNTSLALVTMITNAASLTVNFITISASNISI